MVTRSGRFAWPLTAARGRPKWHGDLQQLHVATIAFGDILGWTLQQVRLNAYLVEWRGALTKLFLGSVDIVVQDVRCRCQSLLHCVHRQ